MPVHSTREDFQEQRMATCHSSISSHSYDNRTAFFSSLSSFGPQLITRIMTINIKTKTTSRRRRRRKTNVFPILSLCLLHFSSPFINRNLMPTLLFQSLYPSSSNKTIYREGTYWEREWHAWRSWDPNQEHSHVKAKPGTYTYPYNNFIGFSLHFGRISLFFFFFFFPSFDFCELLVVGLWRYG